MKTGALIFLVFVASTCSAQQHFRWLLGAWKLQNKNVYEVWTADPATGGLSGKSYSIKGADTLVTETIKLRFFAGSHHYIPDVAGDQPPVDFKITSFDKQSFVAENPQHDFPKIIRYRYLLKNSNGFLEAAIEGDGKIISYVFEKLK